MAVRNNFSSRLLAWHVRHGRHDLPWQSQPPDVYRVWLSEIMLQQTQVATVIPYFQKFVGRFPDIASLARASEQDVLALWSGLGYYARARNLHACARRVVREFSGEFPRLAKDLECLPGIGASTAAAIASTVSGERVAILDGNVKRVLARMILAKEPWGSPALDRRLAVVATQYLPPHRRDMPRYTQAIMDLGALVCKAKTPVCGDCPVSAICEAFGHRETHLYPRPRRKRAVAKEIMHWVVLKNDRGVWLMQRPGAGIWGGLWTPWAITLNQKPRGWNRFSGSLIEVIRLRHALTHMMLTIEAGIFDVLRPPAFAPQELQQFSWKDALQKPLPAPVRALLSRLCPSETVPDAAPRRKNRP